MSAKTTAAKAAADTSKNTSTSGSTPTPPTTTPVVATGAAKTVDIASLAERADLRDLLPRDQAVVDQITDQMRARGFDQSTPIIALANTKEVVDGYTRLAAARAAGLTQVFVQFVTCADETALCDYALLAQFARRNLTKEQRLVAALSLHRPGKAGRPKSGTQPRGKSSDRVAKLLGVSPATIEADVRFARQNPDVFDEIKAGKVTLADARKKARTAGAATTTKSAVRSKPAPTGPDYTGIVTALENAVHLAAKKPDLMKILQDARAKILALQSAASKVPNK